MRKLECLQNHSAGVESVVFHTGIAHEKERRCYVEINESLVYLIIMKMYISLHRQLLSVLFRVGTD